VILTRLPIVKSKKRTSQLEFSGAAAACRNSDRSKNANPWTVSKIQRSTPQFGQGASPVGSDGVMQISCPQMGQ
jgi:hypothetical protein